MNGKVIYYKRRLRELAGKVFGKDWKSALFTPSHAPDCLLSRLLPRWAAVSLRVVGWISLPFYPVFCLFFLDYMNFQKLEKMREFWAEHPLSARFEVLVVLALFLGLLLLLRRGAAAAGTFGAVSLIFGYINYMKVNLNGDYFQPRDFTMVNQVGELTQFISGSLPRWFYLGAVVIVLWTLWLALCGVNLPVRWTVRFPVLIAGILAVCSTFSTMERSNAFLARYNMTFFDAALQSSNYRANGFVGAFTVNLLMNRMEPPEGYSREAVEALLEGREGVRQTGEDYDVIVVLSESFFDVRTLPGVTFSENPLPRYDELLTRAGAFSGTMYSSASRGGTVRPEFEILSGLSTDYLHDVASPYELVDAPLETYVSNYKDAGYATVAIHPYIGSFYRRDKAYPFLGFDEFLDREGVGRIVDLRYERGLVTDETTLAAIEYELEHADRPIFIEAITMENHQPYTKLPEDKIAITVTAPGLDEASLDAVTTYTQGLVDADRMLGELVDYIDSRERPTVLLFYGDHIPNLVNTYDQTGIIGGDPVEELMYVFSTPFLIYTNTAARSGLLPGPRDNQISTYYLLEVVAEMTGFTQTPYMRLLADLYTRVPFYNTRLWSIELTEDVAELRRLQELITYDRLMGERWSNTR